MASTSPSRRREEERESFLSRTIIQVTYTTDAVLIVSHNTKHTKRYARQLSMKDSNVVFVPTFCSYFQNN